MPLGQKRQIETKKQDSNSFVYQSYVQTEEKTDITLSSDAVVDDMVINVNAGHGITVGDSVVLYTDDYQHQLDVVAVVTNAITLEAPLYLNFPAASTTIVRGKRNLNVNGSVTPVEFYFRVYGENIQPVDISAVKFLMTHAGAADDGKFGGIAELPVGVLMRKINDLKFNLGVYRNNQDFKLLNADVVYTDKAPAGANGTEIKFVLNGDENFGQVIRFDPRKSESFLVKVQDDLTSLTSFFGSVIGSYTQGEQTPF